MTQAMIHVVDDDASVREALCRVLELSGFSVRAHASAGDFLTDWPSNDTPGCVLLDVRMPGPSGLDLHQALSHRADAPPVVFMAGSGEIPMSVLAIKHGAVDILAKPIEREPLLAAVNTAIQRSQVRAEHDQRRRVARERFGKLTARERAVFEQVTVGRLNKQIASSLSTCERTVKAHRANMMQKLGVHSVAELVRIAVQLESNQDLALV